jgi:SAM-dependent methyltransferase
MKPELLDALRCAQCGQHLSLRESKAGEGGIVAGHMVCDSGAHSYEIVDGLPVLLPNGTGRNLTQESFAQQWAWHRSGKFEDGSLYGKTAENELLAFQNSFGLASLQQLAGKRILDAGCGSGRLDLYLARTVPTATVVGMDFSESARGAYAAVEGVPNAHILQGDLLRAPFAPESFDYVWSEGVLHHLPDSKAGLDALSRLVKPGGYLYIWVYESGYRNPYRAARALLYQPYRLPSLVRYLISWTLAIPLYLALRVRAATTGAGRGYTFRRGVFSFFDTLSPEYCRAHSREEVRGWFASLGYQDLNFVGHLGMRGHKPAACVEKR